MITAELVSYIEDCKKSGFRFSAIKETLIAYGWEESDIAHAYLQVSNMLPQEKHIATPTTRSFRKISKYMITVILSVSLSMLGAGTYLSLHAQTQQQIITPISFSGTPTETPRTPSTMTAPIASISASPSPSTTPSPTTYNTTVLKKASYSIAIIGDSMVDTMGEKMDFLQTSLQNRYPNTSFTLYNYGIGAQNIEQGLARFSTQFDYKTRHYKALSDLHPDIIVVASFAYNPFSPHDKNKHLTLLSQLVQDAKSTGSKVYMLAEIAPLGNSFAKGPNGIADWTDTYRIEHAQEIIDQLQNAISVAKSQGVGLIDAFEQTEVNGTFGSTTYTNTIDGIHPSDYGHTFTANLIAKTLQFE